jgi:hypothetical protein
VILLAAMLAALLVGVLTFAQTVSWPGSLLAGLAAAAMTLTSLHLVIE